MRKLKCVAKVQNGLERRALMAWVKSTANAGFSELGEQITLNYVTEDPATDDRWWGIIHVFEQYPEHTIEDTVA